MNILTVQDLALGYDGQTIADQISFTLNRGDYLCIVGENGSGKTTLMKTLLGLQKPISGIIRREGNPGIQETPEGEHSVYSGYTL